MSTELRSSMQLCPTDPRRKFRAFSALLLLPACLPVVVPACLPAARQRQRHSGVDDAGGSRVGGARDLVILISRGA